MILLIIIDPQSHTTHIKQLMPILIGRQLLHTLSTSFLYAHTTPASSPMPFSINTSAYNFHYCPHLPIHQKIHHPPQDSSLQSVNELQLSEQSLVWYPVKRILQVQIDTVSPSLPFLYYNYHSSKSTAGLFCTIIHP